MQKPTFIVMLLAIGSLLTLAGFLGAEMLTPPASSGSTVDPEQLAKFDARLKIVENKLAVAKTFNSDYSVLLLSENKAAPQGNALADLLNTLPKNLWPLVTVYSDPNTKTRAAWVETNILSKSITLTATVARIEGNRNSDHPEVPLMVELPVVEIWGDTPRFIVDAHFPDMSPAYFAGKKVITFTGKIQYIEFAPYTTTTPRLSLTDCQIVTKLSTDPRSADASLTGNSAPLP